MNFRCHIFHNISLTADVNTSVVKKGTVCHVFSTFASSAFSLFPLFFQIFLDILSGVGLRYLRHLFRCSLRNDRSTAVSAFRSHVDDVIRRLDHVQIVLNNHHGIAAVGQSPQNLDQLVHIRKMESGRRLIQNVDRLSGASLGEFGYRVEKLVRVRIMNIELGSLKSGTYRNVTEEEYHELLRLTADSSSDPVMPAKKTGEKKR